MMLNLIYVILLIPKAHADFTNISIPGFLLSATLDSNLSDLGKSGYKGLAVYVANYLQPIQVTLTYLS